MSAIETLPHGRARRACRALRGLCATRRIAYNLLPQSALPEVPGRGRARNGSPSARPNCLPVPYFHVVFTLPAAIAAIAYPEQGRRSTTSCSGPPPRRCSRSPPIPSISARASAYRRAPHLGLGDDPSSARPYHRAGRRHIARWVALDRCKPGFCPCGCCRACSGGSFWRRFAAPRGRPAGVLRRSRRSPQGVSTPRSRLAPLRELVRLRQAAFRRAGSGACLSRALHSPRRHRQQPAHRARRGGVTFQYKDYRRNGRRRYRTMTLGADEFISRFLLHVLPNGFHLLGRRIHPIDPKGRVAEPFGARDVPSGEGGKSDFFFSSLNASIPI